MKLTPLLLTALLLPGTPAQAQDKLRLGMEGAYPPFSEIGTDGKLKGFDVDIGMALCAKMKAECSIVQAEFDAMIPALRAKKFDLIIASMSITPERQKAVDFSNTYYDSVARMVTRADAKFEVSPEGLKGKRIGVQRTTIHDRYATAVFKGAEIVRYAKQDEVYLDMVSGRIDATLGDMIAADQGFLKTPAGKPFAFRGPSYNDPKYFGLGAGIAARKGEKALIERVNKALAEVLADGTYKKINDKYFPFSIAPVPATKP